MSEINAVEFKTFINGTHTPDGSHGLFKFMTEQGEFTIALPDDQMPKLMAVLSGIAAKNAQLKSGDKAQKHSFPCTMWAVNLDAENTPVLSFKVPGGMEMSFQLSRSNLPLLREALTELETKLK